MFLVVCIFLFSLPVVLSKPAFAQGNLAVILNVSEGISTTHHGIKGEFSQQSLWCQATEDGETALELHNASFQRTYSPHRHEAEIENGNRAYYKFGKPTTRDIGKYKCDMVTADGKRAWGNLFVYMRPVFHTNGSTRLEVPDDDDKFTVTASSIKFSEGDTVTINCPAVSYPAPDIEWFKNDKMISK
uniref:Ig-like domain-containing protein n=1 Tax=Panagrolaimus sp. ES5 TaxID=591445 RepID=A0AC34FRG5_9BILA